MKIKRGTKVTYQFAGGKVVAGVIVRQHDGDMSDWFVVRLTDEVGTNTGSCHREQIMVTDNRPNRVAA